MTTLQLNLIRDLLNTQEYDIRINLGKTWVKVTGIKFYPSRSARILTEVGEIEANRYTQDKISVKKIIEYKLFSSQGEPRVLLFQGIKWVCVPFEDTKIGDFGLNIQKNQLELIVELIEPSKQFKTFYKGRNDSNVESGVITNRKYKHEIIPVRPLFPNITPTISQMK